MGVATRHVSSGNHSGMPPNLQPMVRPLVLLRAGVALEQVSRHAVVFKDASATGWGATYNGQAVSGVWTGPPTALAQINCLELLAVYLALGRLKGPLRGKHVLVRSDNTATVAYINRQGGLRSRRIRNSPAISSFGVRSIWGSLRAIHVPGVLNRVADELSRAALPGEWRLHPQVVQLIWGEFGEAQVDLFASLGTSHCQLFYSLSEGTTRHRCTGAQLAPGPSQVCVSPSEPTCTDLVQSQGGRGAGLASCALLAQLDLVPGTHAPRDSPSLASSSEKGPSFLRDGAPFGTRVQTSGNSMSGPWTGRGGTRWLPPWGT